MRTYKIKYRNKTYITDASDKIEAVRKIKDKVTPDKKNWMYTMYGTTGEFKVENITKEHAEHLLKNNRMLGYDGKIEEMKNSNTTDASPSSRSRLEQLSGSNNHLTKYNAATAENATAKVLETLSQDPAAPIRAAVAHNIKCPVYILEKLAGDRDKYVRAGVAVNKNTPENTLRRLTSDKEDIVKTLAKRRLHITDNAIHDTRTVNASELKVGDIIYSSYSAQHPEKVKCRVDKIIKRQGLLNIQLSEMDGSYFKTTQVSPSATFLTDNAVKDSSYIDYGDGESPFDSFYKLQTEANKFNLDVKIIKKHSTDEWHISGKREDLENFVRKYYNKDQVEFIHDSVNDDITSQQYFTDSNSYVISYRNLITDNQNKVTITAESVKEAIQQFADNVALEGIGTANILVYSVSPNDGYMQLYGKLNRLLKTL